MVEKSVTKYIQEITKFFSHQYDIFNGTVFLFVCQMSREFC